MLRTPLFVVLTFCSITCLGQADEAGIKSTIDRFFEGLRTADSMKLKSALSPAVIFQTIVQKGGNTMVQTENIQEFITAVTKPHPEIYDERITYDAIKTDGTLAFAWTPYKFYVGDKFSHCGVNSFQLVKIDGVWKIQYIIDTRRKEPCN